MFSGRHTLKSIEGKIFIDRDPDRFKMLVTYLRDRLEDPPMIKNDSHRVQFNKELRYWGLDYYQIPGEAEKKLIKGLQKSPAQTTIY